MFFSKSPLWAADLQSISLNATRKQSWILIMHALLQSSHNSIKSYHLWFILFFGQRFFNQVYNNAQLQGQCNSTLETQTTITRLSILETQKLWVPSFKSSCLSFKSSHSSFESFFFEFWVTLLEFWVKKTKKEIYLY
jgi:hypothetical protein